MQEFRLYLLDEQGQVLAARRFHAPGVDEALSAAPPRAAPEACLELWIGPVCVVRQNRSGG